MRPMVSVIVPVFNVQEYVRNCVESIIQQSYEKLEILLVNDGSTDESEIICQQLVEKDSRIKLFNKPNGGLSSARNLGIEHASGEYISFIDSDDWIEKDYIECLVTILEETKSDISVFHMKKETNPIPNYSESQDVKQWKHFSSYKALVELFTNNNIGYNANNKLYRKKLFANVRYPEGKLMEDKATTYKLIDLASSGVEVSETKKYHYFIRLSGIMKSKFTREKFDSFDIHEEILAYMTEKHPELNGLVEQRYVYEAIRMLMSLIESNDLDVKNYQRCTLIVQKYGRKKADSESSTSHLYKILVLLICFCPQIPVVCGKSNLFAKFLRKLETF